MFSRFSRPVWYLLFVLAGVPDCADGQELRKAVSSPSQEAIVQTNATLCALVKNPELYNGKEVTIQAKYVLGFEWSALFSEECPDDMIWLEPRELDNASTQTLKRANDAGPTSLALPAYLTVQGTFVSGGHYGHMSGYSYQITAHKVFSLLKIASKTHVLTDADVLDWKSYWTSIPTSIDKSWLSNVPESVQKGEQGKNSVTFRILRDGSVPADSVKLVSSSGTSELDEASRKAIHAAAPFGHLPEEFSQPFVQLCTVFYYNSRPNPPREENPYFKALFASIIAMDKAYAPIDDSIGGGRVRTDYHRMLVERDSSITDDLPEHFGDYHAEYLDTRKLIARFKKLKKEFSVLRIQPGKTVFDVLVSVHWVSYKKGKLNFGLSDWSEVRLQYDCEKQVYIVSNVRLGGV